MMRLVFSALLLAVAAPISQAQDLFWTPRRVESIKNIAGAAVSPDGSRVAYLVAVPRNPGVDDDGSPWTELHVLSTADGAARAYVSGKVNVGKLGFTPDGEGLAFLAKREGDKQTSLYVLPLDGGEAQKKIELARQYYTLAEKEGFFSHFGAYNEEILRPLKNAGEFTADGVKKEILATLMLQPLDARSGFVLYNVLAFLAGVAESSIAMALGYGWFSFVWNACVGYCFAYSLYWVFLCKQMKVRSTISIVLCADA